MSRLNAVSTEPTAPRRADARRNVDRILDAGLTLFAQDPKVSMTDVARAAGVGRVTLYGHFSSREELLTAVVDRAVTQATRAMDERFDDDLDPGQLIVRLVESAWETLERFGRVRLSALESHSPEWLRDMHDPVLRRMESLFSRGQAEGLFRTDVPVSWMVTTLYALLHAADDEVAAGRLERSAAASLVTDTLQAAFAPPP